MRLPTSPAEFTYQSLQLILRITLDTTTLDTTALLRTAVFNQRSN